MLGDGAFLAPGVVLCGNVHVGDSAFVGAGAVVRERVNIGRNAVIGCGAAVVEDVAEYARVCGVPARVMRP